MDEVAEQVAQVWMAMLAQMTAAGASRLQIVTMTLETAEAVLSNTSGALWPGGEPVPQEEGDFQGFRDHLEGIRDHLRGLDKEGVV